MNARSIFFAVLPFAAAGFAQSDWETPRPTAGATTPREGSYVVRRWDTLWDLAHHHLGDPFRWRDIWSLNQHISNPDLIFPGDPLMLPGAGSGTGPYPRAASYSGTETHFQTTTRGFLDNAPAVETPSSPEMSNRDLPGTAPASSLDETIISQRLTSAGFFSPGFLARVGFLWFDKDDNGDIYPGNGTVSSCKKASVFRLHDEITISLHRSGRYLPGDTIDILHSDRFVKYERRTANLVRRVARAYIISASDKAARARLFATWDVVLCKDRVTPVKRFPEREIAALTTPDRAIEGAVFEHIETTEGPYLYHTFVCDRGSAGGVREGDLLMVYPVEQEKVSPAPSALVCVVNVQETSSSAAVVKMYSERILPGDRTVLVKRTAFK